MTQPPLALNSKLRPKSARLPRDDFAAQAQQPGPNNAKPGRSRRRQAILRVAREVFVASGYGGASMSDIAARLGGSKGTLYNYFKGKDELFTACVDDACAKLAELSGDGEQHVDGSPLAASLQRAGESLLATVCSKDWRTSFQLVAPRASQAPQLALHVYETATAAARRQIIRALTESGAATPSAAHDIVEPFIGLCLGDLPMRLLLGLAAPLTSAQVQRQTAQAVSQLLVILKRPPMERDGVVRPCE